MQRKKYDPGFKGRIALELCKGLKTVNEIASEYSVHPHVITKWKQQLLESLPQIFAGHNGRQNKELESEKLIASLYQKIGQLEMELEWLKKKSVLLHSR